MDKSFVFKIKGKVVAELNIFLSSARMTLSVTEEISGTVKGIIDSCKEAQIFEVDYAEITEGEFRLVYTLGTQHNFSSKSSDFRFELGSKLGCAPIETGYMLEDWLYDCAEEAGMIFCPHCLEWFSPEDGHPPGTLCPVYGDLGNEEALDPYRYDPTGYMARCAIHGCDYFSENGCPECWEAE